MRIRSKAWLVAAFSLGLALAAYANHQSIAELLRDPGRYDNKEVSITGWVVDSYGVMGNGAYQVDDGTGRMWVIAAGRGVPSRGARVEVTGSLYDTATIRGMSVGTVLHEKRRRRSE
ncbi:MAG: hypothetical protein M3O85_06665 [Acidobacteriota bacterium]|nr:hypothetical protein [Acidobacteriota bacterium]